MFSKSSKNKTGLCQVCSVVMLILALVALIGTLAAIVGVFKAHFLSEGLTFGTLNGSASLIALALNIFVVKKLMGYCPCNISTK